MCINLILNILKISFLKSFIKGILAFLIIYRVGINCKE
jgi:hypothetical protein